MYDHTKQYRCTIIRGKSKKEMDDLLPAYALVINEICPCSTEEFKERFNYSFEQFLPESDRKKKTLDNHRSEIAGKLFGMYYCAEDGMVYESQRTTKYLEDNDQPAFFKDVCYKMQFPNGMDKPQTVQSKVSEEINIRPNAFVLKLLQLAKTANQPITVKDIGYYVLNSLDVLQGKANPYEVLETIVNDHHAGLQREIKAYGDDGESKASSYTMQHIREQLNYLELANLIRITEEKCVVLNPNEMDTINLFTAEFDKPPEFDVYSYNLENSDTRREFQHDWDEYYSQLSLYASDFATSSEALSYKAEDNDSEDAKKKPVENLTAFGDEGEALVYEYEKNRVAAYSTRLANKVLAVGKIKGLGYDIQSVIAEPGEMEEFVKYIEVKSTKRYTCPDPDDSMWVDTLVMTRNEWIAATQHKDFYSIARVYFTNQGVTMFFLSNIAEKIEDRRMKASPMNFRVDFSNTSIDQYVVLQAE